LRRKLRDTVFREENGQKRGTEQFFHWSRVVKDRSSLENSPSEKQRKQKQQRGARPSEKQRKQK
jgi:hypothetical protein